MNCTVQSLSHTWSFGPLSDNTISSGAVTDTSDMGFTFQLVAVIGNTAIVTSATGTVFAELNNTEILCRDGLRLPGQGGEPETATIKVFGIVANS